MILGLGTDVVAVTRIRALCEKHGERFLARVFTDAERAVCQGRARPEEGFAARFAVKEAAMKALGTGWAGGVGWQDVELLSAEQGPPALALSGEAARVARRLGVTRRFVSVSHDGGVALATVILEGEQGREPSP